MFKLLILFLGTSTLLSGGCTNIHTPTTEVSARSPIATKRLLIALDGVGYSQFKKLQEGGYFRQFKPVAPMVSSFPSISDPNWALIMNTEVETSYTKEYIDIEYRDGKKIGRKVGSLLNHLSQPPLYETLFDFKPEGVLQHLASLTWSETTGLYWLDVIEKDLFNNSSKELYQAFIFNTDVISHTKGEQDILRYLSEVDSKLIGLEKRYQEKFKQNLEIILLSDHGNIFLKPKAILPDERLAKKKWNLKDYLENERDVVYVIPEILSFAAFYTLDKSKAALATDLAEIEGVHVTLTYQEPNRIMVYSKNTIAQIDVDPKRKTVGYRIVKGQDPFSHSHLFKKGPLSWPTYFHETLATKYPYALVRAWEAFTTNSKQKPSVLVSTKSGYVFANKALEWITMVMGLESVHGSFEREESLGILVSNKREFPALPVREIHKLVIQ
ncbi:MAG: hypothetical protein AB7F59_04780 [Bdellovibrionales bacterium]